MINQSSTVVITVLHQQKLAWDSESTSAASSTSCFCSGLFVVSLSFKFSLRQKFLTRWNSCSESCRSVNWSVSVRLKRAESVSRNSACQVARDQFRTWGTSLDSTANQLVVLSPVAKRGSVEQPIGTCAHWNDLWKRWERAFHTLHLNTDEENQGYRTKEKCRSRVFFQTIWITIRWKVLMDFWHDDTKDKLPTSAFSKMRTNTSLLV